MNSDYGCQFLPFLRYRRANLAIDRLTLFVRCGVDYSYAAFLTFGFSVAKTFEDEF